MTEKGRGEWEEKRGERRQDEGRGGVKKGGRTEEGRGGLKMRGEGRGETRRGEGRIKKKRGRAQCLVLPLGSHLTLAFTPRG